MLSFSNDVMLHVFYEALVFTAEEILLVLIPLTSGKLFLYSLIAWFRQRWPNIAVQKITVENKNTTDEHICTINKVMLDKASFLCL